MSCMGGRAVMGAAQGWVQLTFGKLCAGCSIRMGVAYLGRSSVLGVA